MTGGIGRWGFFLSMSNVLQAVLAYLLQMAMARLLGISEYGVFAAFVAAMQLVAVPLSAAGTFLARIVTLEDGREGRAVARRLAVDALSLAAKAMVFAGVVAAAASPWLAQVMETSTMVSAGFLMASVMQIPLFCCMGIFQGLGRFAALAVAGVGLAGLRTGLAIGLVAAVGGVLSASCGMMVATVVVTALSVVAVLRRGRAAPRQRSRLATAGVVPFLVSSCAFATLMFFDVPVVRAGAAPRDAGLYSAAALLAKALVWVPVGYVAAMHPAVAGAVARGRPTRLILAKTGVITLGFSGAAAMLLLALPGWILSVLFGNEYRAAAGVLRWLVVAFLPVALLMVADNYVLAKGSSTSACALVAAAVATVVFASGAAADTGAFARRLALSNALATISVWLVAARTVASERREDGTGGGVDPSTSAGPTQPNPS